MVTVIRDLYSVPVLVCTSHKIIHVVKCLNSLITNLKALRYTHGSS